MGKLSWVVLAGATLLALYAPEVSKIDVTEARPSGNSGTCSRRS